MFDKTLTLIQTIQLFLDDSKMGYYGILWLWLCVTMKTLTIAYKSEVEMLL